MRRSAAPSQIGSKRAKYDYLGFLRSTNGSLRFSKDTFKFPYNVPTFNLPRSYRRTFLDFTSNQNLSSLSASSNAKQGPLPPKQPSGPPAARSSQDVLKLLFNKHCENEPASPNENASCIAAKSSTDPDGNARYFTVVWCKISAKKHKDWKEDAIMIVKQRSVTLKNMQGKEIGQSSGYKLAELQELENGSTLKVGGREVMIQDPISESSYLSGSCFGKTEELESASPNQSLLKSTQRPVATKHFVSPFQKNKTGQTIKTTNPEIKPKHNPLGHMALVMPKPPPEIQWKECQNGVSIIDVVVDPLLCKHLRPHQREGVIFLYECVMGFKTANMYGAILADEMGLGKTLQCITLIWTLLHQGPFNGRPTIQRVLVISPSSLTQNWHKEFRRWLGRERINVFIVDQQNRPVEFAKRPLLPVMVVSYEMFVRCFDDIQKIKFDLIVCDEAHRLKNAGNKTSSMLSQLNIDRKVLLTGTPVQNDLKEFFTLADYVNPGIFGTMSAFRRSYEAPILSLQLPECDEDQLEIGNDCAAQLSHLTSQFVLRRTQQVMTDHLPPKVESVIFCRPSPAQIRMYNKLLGSSSIRSLLTSSYSGNDHLTCIQILRQLCNHPSFVVNKQQSFSDQYGNDDEDDLDRSLGNGTEHWHNLCEAIDDEANATSGKFQVTMNLLDSFLKNTREKIVFVSYSTKMLDLFGEACSQRGYSSLRLDGSTPTVLRMGLVDRFNDPQGKDRIFLLSSKAGGVGLNLVGASRLILYDIDWNPANDLQAMARIWRDGQRKTVRIYRLLTTGTIEEKIFQRQVLKQGLSGTVVDARESTQAHFTKDELKDLFSLREDTDCDTHDLVRCPCQQSRSSPCLQLDDYQFEDEDVAVDERDCQLGSKVPSSSNKEVHKTVDQLLDWQHHSRPFDLAVLQDGCLEDTLEDVSFVFRCVSG